jgi:N-acetylmuramoyl-L-alanine amidase
MQLSYPANGHTTAAHQTFAIGSVPPGHPLTLNGQPLTTSPQGYFAPVLPLAFGANTFTFRDDITAQARTVTVHRKQPVAVPVGSVLPHINTMTNHTLMPGDMLVLHCVAGVGQVLSAQLRHPVTGQVWLTVPVNAKPDPGYRDNRQAVFAELTQTQPLISMACHYQATVQVPADCPAVADNTTFQLWWVTAAQAIKAPNTITLWTHPRFAQLTADRVVMRTSPPEGSRLTPQRQGAYVVITGTQGDWVRVRLSGERIAWLPQAKLRLLDNPAEALLNIPALTLKTQPGPLATVSTIHLPGLPHPVPFHVDTTPTGLTLDLFGVVSHCDFIHYHPNERVITRIDWSQPNADTFRLHVTVPRLCGYEVTFDPDSGMQLQVKQLGPHPRILLDPGHGGTEMGSTGPDGTPEKTLNLRLGLQVADAMRAQGLDMTLTRADDRTVSLTERTDMAMGYDMVLSLHHNALPDGRDPQKSQGLSTYYYHPMAKPLAQALLDGLSRTVPNTPAFGLFYDSLALTRIPQAMAVLIEVGFMTHPTEYERLQTPAFQQQFATALATQVKAFIVAN